MQSKFIKHGERGTSYTSNVNKAYLSRSNNPDPPDIVIPNRRGTSARISSGASSGSSRLFIKLSTLMNFPSGFSAESGLISLCYVLFFISFPQYQYLPVPVPSHIFPTFPDRYIPDFR